MTTTERNTRGYRYPELRPGCTACQACSQICPDFVFQVWKFETPVEETFGLEDRQ
jgi:2-oxoglutarate ferredoxin oxidoreductase subunit delta